MGQILSPSPLVPELRNLYLEGRAVEIVAESLAVAMQAEPRIDDGAILTHKDRIKLQRAVDVIAANLVVPLTVEMIAREAGVSASGLQKLFRQSVGLSVFEYVRQQRLERAFTALRAEEVTVSEASLIAGYSNPANFATAFRKRFGRTPRQAARPG
ncbi:helix-turn-helix transcriptional regulator [Neorhizobium sp. DT-125]|uniref:helix-turn-helix transcriptional regulator n=1 Tax=Neorhizobium sp. DT-125 TaxID=3396163 RepID=UPI003F1D5956